MKSYNLKMNLQLFADPSASLQNTIPYPSTAARPLSSASTTACPRPIPR